MNDFPLVSIICTSYNHELFISDALEGFIMQKTSFPFEIIVCDDASTDSTASIIKQYEKQFPKLFKTFYHTENQYSKGIPFFTNELITSSVGKYIALCEGDDYWIDPLKLQKQVDFLDKNTAYTMCFHNAIERWEHDINKNNLFSKVRDRDYSGFYLLKNWIIPTASVMLRSSIYKTELYGKVLNCNDFLYGDTPMFVTCAEYGKIRGFSDIMSVYRRNEGGVTMMAKSYEHYCRLGIHIDTFHRVFGKSYYSPLFVSEIYLTSAFHLCQSRDFISAIKMLAQNPYKIYYLISPISIIMKTLVHKIRKYYNGKFKY